MTRIPRIALVVVAGVLAAGSAIGQDHATTLKTPAQFTAKNANPPVSTHSIDSSSDRAGQVVRREESIGEVPAQSAIYFHHPCITIP